MFQWFRRAPSVRETGLAMVDPRAGDHLLVIGAADPRLAASCAAATGLNGRAVVVGRGDDQRRQIEQAAASAGALIEFIDAPLTMLPFDDAAFGLVVVPKLRDDQGEPASAKIGEAVRVLKPAGRLVAVAGQKRAGIFGALQTAEPRLAVDDVLTYLKAAGAVAARRLAEVEGVAYYEARKPR